MATKRAVAVKVVKTDKEKSVDEILSDRGSKYGSFKTHAEITQALKAVMRATPNWEGLPAHHKESLEMTAHKIGRMLNGDPSYDDNFKDVNGYNELSRKIYAGENP